MHSKAKMKNPQPEDVADYIWAAHYHLRHEQLGAATQAARVRSRQRQPTLEQIAKRTAAVAAARSRLEARFAAEVLPLASLRLNNFMRLSERDKLARPLASDAALWIQFVRLNAKSKDKDALLVWRAECEPPNRDERAQRLADKNADVFKRLTVGFEYEGGVIGDYVIEPITYRGLVSAEHPVLEFFLTKLMKGKWLNVGWDKAEAYTVGSKLLACDAPYVEGNKSMRGFIRVEVDQVLSFDDIEAGCRAAGVPLPNIVVGWSGSGRVHRPHLIWLLTDSVAFTPKSKLRFRALFKGVLNGLTSALAPMGADAGGVLNCMRTKNPLSPIWSRRVMAEAPYSLSALAECVDTKAKLAEATVGTVTQDHPDAEVAAGSNSFFRCLAGWARQEVHAVRDIAAAEFAEWSILVASEALRLCAGLSGDSRKAEPSAVKLAQRVAEWTWSNIKPQAPKADPEEAAEKRAGTARKTAATRAGRSQTAIVAAALELASAGGKVTQVAVRERVKANGGTVSIRTVQTHWHAVTAAFEKNTQYDNPVKKHTPIRPDAKPIPFILPTLNLTPVGRPFPFSTARYNPGHPVITPTASFQSSEKPAAPVYDVSDDLDAAAPW